MRIWSGMGCGMSSPWHNLAKKNAETYSKSVPNDLGFHGMTCKEPSEGIKGGSIYCP